MNPKPNFERFAPAILKIFHRDEEAFWAAVMAPFLINETSLLDWMQNLKVDVDLISAFRGLDDDARRTLQEFSEPLGFDLTRWKSNRAQYLKDAYPVFAMLAVWMDGEGQQDLIDQYADILTAGVFAVAGYGILDENVDSDRPSPVEILTANALIAEYERRVLLIFGVTPTNLEILRKMSSLFLEAEIHEKFMRGKSSPYRLDRPQDLGAKGANSLAPFMLTLERLGRADQIEDYWQVFLLFGAAIQMIDDWQDLEKDLALGHFSYPTLGCEKQIDRKDPKKSARMLRADRDHVRHTYAVSKKMLAESRAILMRLNDIFLPRLVDVVELRLDSYFRKEFGISGSEA